MGEKWCTQGWTLFYSMYLTSFVSRVFVDCNIVWPPLAKHIVRWRAVCQLCGDRNGDPPWARSRQDQVKKEARVLILWGDYELLEFTQKIELEEWNSSTHKENLLLLLDNNEIDLPFPIFFTSSLYALSWGNGGSSSTFSLIDGVFIAVVNVCAKKCFPCIVFSWWGSLKMIVNNYMMMRGEGA